MLHNLWKTMCSYPLVSGALASAVISAGVISVPLIKVSASLPPSYGEHILLAQMPNGGGMMGGGQQPGMMPPPNGNMQPGGYIQGGMMGGSGGGQQPGMMQGQQPYDQKENVKADMGQDIQQQKGINADDKQQKAMQAQQDERQKNMEKQQLENMKRGMKQASLQMTQMKNYFNKQAKKGVKIPEDCVQALAAVQQFIDKIKNASSMDEMSDVDMDSISDQFNAINECRQKVDALARMSGTLKQMDRQIKNTEQQWNKAKKSAPKEASSAIADGDALLQSVKDARRKISDLLATVEVDEIQSIMQDDIYGKFDDLGDVIQRINSVKNSKRFFTDFNRRLKDSSRTISNLKRTGQDMSEAEQILSDMKDQYAALKNMSIGSEDFMDAVQNLMQRGQELSDALGGNQNSPIPQQNQKEPSNDQGLMIQMPQF